MCLRVHGGNEAANHQLPMAVAFWILQLVSVKKCSSLRQSLMQIQCSTHCHFEWDSHTAHTLTQWCLPPPLTSTVKSSLFAHAHSSPLSLAVRLHRRLANSSHHINIGWNFPRLCTYSHTSVLCHWDLLYFHSFVLCSYCYNIYALETHESHKKMFIILTFIYQIDF